MINSTPSLDWNRAVKPPAFPMMGQNSSTTFTPFGGLSPPQQPNYLYSNSANAPSRGGSAFPHQDNSQLPPTSTMYGRPKASSTVNQPVENTQSNKTPLLSQADIMDLLGWTDNRVYCDTRSYTHSMRRSSLPPPVLSSNLSFFFQLNQNKEMANFVLPKLASKTKQRLASAFIAWGRPSPVQKGD